MSADQSNSNCVEQNEGRRFEQYKNNPMPLAAAIFCECRGQLMADVGAWNLSSPVGSGGLRPRVPVAARVFVGVQLVVSASAQHQLGTGKKKHARIECKRRRWF